jgi:transcriptional regulator with XRE-family HTH domain
MILLRRVIGDALRARRQSQHRTLREVSTAANVSLGYLSEIERGQKEASSELLAAICDALGAQLSELLREVSTTVAAAERVGAPTAPEPSAPVNGRVPARAPAAPAPVVPAQPQQLLPAATPIMLPKGVNAGPARALSVDGDVAVSVHQSGPLKATLRATRNNRASRRGRDVVCAL